LNEFIWPIRVYYEDTDSGGVVYHSNYLNFMERARTEWLRSMALEQDDIIKQHSIVFVVHSLSIDYIKPALFNEALVVKTCIEKLARASIIFKQVIVSQGADVDNEQILTQATVKIVSLSLAKKRPSPLPKAIYEKFSQSLLS
jgi:acyl-CoA thioester hydrolase